jgi:integrase/recombinase XerC
MREALVHKYQAQFERYVALTTSSATSIRYSKALENFFRRFSDKDDPSEFTRRDIEEYKILRLRDGVVNRTVNYEIRVVGSFWNWLIRMELVAHNPCTTARSLKEIDPVKKSLSEDEQNRLYSSVGIVGSLLDKLLVGLALSTGLRAETLVQLETSDVDFDTATLRIPATKMKAGRNHEVPIRQDVMKLIKQLPEGRFFNNYASNARGLAYRFNRILKRGGLKLRGLRVGRRTFATTLLRTGTDIALVQTLMGHRSVLTTSKYLTPADAATTKAAIDRLPQPKEEVILED